MEKMFMNVNKEMLMPGMIQWILCANFQGLKSR